MTAGKLRASLNFQRRTVESDGYGNEVVGDFATVFTDHAEIIPRMGSEAVMGARLQGLQPVTIKVRSHTATRALDAAWRAVDARSGEVYAITSPPVNTDQKNRYIEMLATIGTQAAA